MKRTILSTPLTGVIGLSVLMLLSAGPSHAVDLRLHVIPLSNSDGTKAYNVTPQQFADLVTRVNAVYAGTGIRFVFDQNADWAPMADTELNTDGANMQSRGNAIAASLPGEIVCLLRWGNGTSPTGNGNAYPPPGNAPKPPDVPDIQQDYVALPDSMGSPSAYQLLNQGNGSFVAHELGHYLGLYHTFPGWGDPYSGVYTVLWGVTSAAAADQAVINYIAQNGGTINALDGDRISDTPPDPSVLLYMAHNQNICIQPTITVTGIMNNNPVSLTFAPDRGNVMSYYSSCSNPPTPQHFSPQQIQRMTQTLTYTSRRALLVENGPFYVSGKSTVTYTNSQGVRVIDSFASGKNGHLVVNYWDGASWHWADQGLPTGVTAIYNPNAIVWEPGGTLEIDVFATANNGHLVVNYWDGSAWKWADQGLPAGTTAMQFPSATTFGIGAQQLRVFGTGSNGHLLVNYWDGGSWRWADQGLPAGATAFQNPSAITPDGEQLYVFGNDVHGALNSGDLLVEHWNGGYWQWEDRGYPPPTLLIVGVSSPKAMVYSGGGSPTIYVFCTNSDGQLVVNYQSGSSWYWAGLGKPAGAAAVYYPDAVTYGSLGLYVFGAADNGHLVLDYWDGGGWHWIDQGLPAGATAVSHPSAITFGSIGPYAFSTNNSHLFLNYWDGGGWRWADQGSL
jgi:hypothetical protein